MHAVPLRQDSWHQPRRELWFLFPFRSNAFLLSFCWSNCNKVTFRFLENFPILNPNFSQTSSKKVVFFIEYHFEKSMSTSFTTQFWAFTIQFWFKLVRWWSLLVTICYKPVSSLPNFLLINLILTVNYAVPLCNKKLAGIFLARLYMLIVQALCTNRIFLWL